MNLSVFGVLSAAGALKENFIFAPRSFRLLDCPCLRNSRPPASSRLSEFFLIQHVTRLWNGPVASDRNGYFVTARLALGHFEFFNRQLQVILGSPSEVLARTNRHRSLPCHPPRSSSRPTAVHRAGLPKSAEDEAVGSSTTVACRGWPNSIPSRPIARRRVALRRRWLLR